MMYGIAAAAAETDRPRGSMLGNTATEVATDGEVATIVREAFADIEAALARARAEGKVAPG